MKSIASIILTLIGIGFIVAFFFTDPEAKTDDGYSLRYFFLVMGLWFVGLQVAIFAFFRFRASRRKARLEELKLHGRRATATVLSSTTTGLMVNHVPQIKVTLKLKNIFGKEIIVHDKKFFPLTEIHKITPGLEVQALIDPEKKKSFLILWEEAGIAQSYF
ncbi:MAG: hypothetical protein OZ913_07345 [Ignavibacteriaceae bacterium]|jgi:hypothetical protein|nr:MAG: hypothetical protein EDM69_08505 [Chlorobiota bacterium]KXK01759.1 MAG: hypothetical protein UZ04_CHB001002144 [Chlorobi bacterium OLB4]MBV6399025.1 hypothetical protein [Ignavibacteria bacterium]MCC6885946.1 hypothetical protein [Ignavibacteriales bacterium]MCE7953397.1 hypothetical protein [Chlorobi bacterium CHB7]MDL1887333.1 hypothetical protein [Ignavibacteria bacterium CHB1]MEB2330104.1 hypothetical protein [Ignavibacteriaceae bacterium]OQY77194.1 MAG: hypothetical protein B6D4